MKKEYNVYVKGRGHDNIASCAIIIIEDGVEIKADAMVFKDKILTKSRAYPILPFKAQYQMEIYAITWAITLCDDNSHINIYTNNVAIKSWIENESVSEEYSGLFSAYMERKQNKVIAIHHIKKDSDMFTERCNTLASDSEMWLES